MNNDYHARERRLAEEDERQLAEARARNAELEGDRRMLGEKVLKLEAINGILDADYHSAVEERDAALAQFEFLLAGIAAAATFYNSRIRRETLEDALDWCRAEVRDDGTAQRIEAHLLALLSTRPEDA